MFQYYINSIKIILTCGECLHREHLHSLENILQMRTTGQLVTATIRETIKFTIYLQTVPKFIYRPTKVDRFSYQRAVKYYLCINTTATLPAFSCK